MADTGFSALCMLRIDGGITVGRRGCCRYITGLLGNLSSVPIATDGCFEDRKSLAEALISNDVDITM